MIVVVLALVLLHGPDGSDIYVNPEAVTAMRAATPGAKNKYLTDEAKCLLNISDGKFIAVVETCEAVRRLLQGHRDNSPF